VDLLSVIRRWHHREGLAIREIRRRTGLSRNTIRKYLSSDVVEPRYPARKSTSKLDPYAEVLRSWLSREQKRHRKQRAVNARFRTMVSHFLFEAEFCNPAAGWEKGQVEKNVRDVRHRLLQDAPPFADLAEANTWLEARCQTLWHELRHPEQSQRTIAEVHANEQAALMALAAPCARASMPRQAVHPRVARKPGPASQRLAPGCAAARSCAGPSDRRGQWRGRCRPSACAAEPDDTQTSRTSRWPPSSSASEKSPRRTIPVHGRPRPQPISVEVAPLRRTSNGSI